MSAPGSIALQFSREASTAFTAITSAIKDIKTVIPRVKIT